MSNRTNTRNNVRASMKDQLALVENELGIDSRALLRRSLVEFDAAFERAKLAKSIRDLQAASDKRGLDNTGRMHDPLFRRACELAGIEPTRRQASKWNNKRGLAWDRRNDAKKALAHV